MSKSPVAIWSRTSRLCAAIVSIIIAVGLGSAWADGTNNVEKPWDSSVALGLSLTRGNSNSENVNGSIQGDKIWTADELRLKLLGLYGLTDGTKSAESLEGNAQWNHSFTPQLYSAVIADGLHDDVARLAYRVTLAPNLGYYFVRNDWTKFSAETGPGFIIQRYEGTDTLTGNRYESQEYVTLRVAERFEQKISATAKCWESVEWLPKIDDFQDYLLNSEIGIEATITKAFSVRTVGNDRYNSQPQPGIKDNDIQLVSSLVYKF